MSYCVNCGVELEKGCKACPLCDTEVINPKEKNADSKPAYPQKCEIPKSVSKRYWVFVASIALIIPNIVLGIIDAVCFESGISIYVFGASALFWIWVLFPLLWKKPIPLILLQIDAVSLVFYINLFRINSEQRDWFGSMAMPIVLSLWAIAALFILWLKKPRSKTLKGIAVLFAINAMCFVVEICSNLFYNGKLQVIISLAVTACFVPVMIFFAALVKSRRLKAWVRRKFFV